MAFEIASENMVFKIQVDCFRQLLRMPCAFFDDPKHSSERLSTRLAADSANARWGMDYPLGYFFSTGTGFVIAVVVASIYGWRMAILVGGISSFSPNSKTLRPPHLSRSYCTLITDLASTWSESTIKTAKF